MSAHKRVTISVTRDHIERGQRAMACRCPIALAINSLLRRGFHAAVGTVDLSIGAQSIDLPEVAIEWAERFDFHGTGEPFSFTLSINEEALKATRR